MRYKRLSRSPTSSSAAASTTVTAYRVHMSHSLQLLLLDSNETDGLIGMNVIWSHFIVRYTVEDSFTVRVACDKKWGRAQKQKLESLGV
jgi:hypothetical protein